ncbi:rhomboid family intramembrane serine protease [Acidipropionibacterium timonense]|uniref:rhomboid family intramembrane serine protease n=1 Tax=Acidipropionibacterium timonense TaxID=2161818 RepID=UPI00102F895C|nr:rhomboid family intramembrane serine protease [Acidipropionibacterium timonense]
MAAVVGIMWVIEALDVALGNSLDEFGIHSWSLSGLWEIFTAPWLHYGWAHLAGNSVPLFILGWLVLVEGTRTWLVSAFVITVCSGLAAWAGSAPGTVTLGASGIVFGWLAYLLVKGLFTRRLGDIVLAVIVFLIYGSVLWGVLPGTAGVSWQGHLGGAVGGVIAASVLTRDQRRR